MTTKKTTTPKGQPQTCRKEVAIEFGKFGKIHDRIMAGTRLVLALHRIEQAKRIEGLAVPEELIAWQAFLSLIDACEELGYAAGYDPEGWSPE